MDQRKRAREILENARELLANRLVDAIIESGDDILDDADGDSYMDEISALQERIGDRLNKVNVMLDNLPPVEPSSVEPNSDEPSSVEPSSDEPSSDEPNSVGPNSDRSSSQELEASREEAPALSTEPEKANTQRPTDFALFGQQIMANDLAGAGQTLSVLLEVDQELAFHCATSFRDRMNEDPATTQKAMLLRSKLQTGQTNDSLMILWDCFGLQGPQAVQVLQTLQTRLEPAP